ncbi:hypothetical protein [Cupriavidus campinensis]
MTDDERINLAREKELATVSPLYRGIYARAYSGQSRAAAVHAFCLRCTGDKRDEVRRCSSYACQLWPCRPYQTDIAEDVDVPNEKQ